MASPPLSPSPSPFVNATGNATLGKLCTSGPNSWILTEPENPRRVGLAMTVLFTIYVVATLAVYYYYRNLPMLKLRQHGLVASGALASWSVLAWTALRFVVGIDTFSCHAWIWLILLAVPLNGLPLVLRINVLQCRYAFAHRVRNMTNDSNVDIVALRQVIRMKDRMEVKWSAIAGLATLGAALVVIFPVYFASAPGVSAQYDNCSGCGTTMPIFATMAVFVGIVFVACQVLLCRIAREGTDTFGIKRELIQASIAWALALIGYLVLWPSFYVAKWRASASLSVFSLLVGAFVYHTLTVVLPVWRALMRRRKAAQTADPSFRAGAGAGADAAGQAPAASNVELLRELLSDKAGYQAFEGHLTREFAMENLTFWKAAKMWKTLWVDEWTVHSNPVVDREKGKQGTTTGSAAAAGPGHVAIEMTTPQQDEGKASITISSKATPGLKSSGGGGGGGGAGDQSPAGSGRRPFLSQESTKSDGPSSSKRQSISTMRSSKDLSSSKRQLSSLSRASGRKSKADLAHLTQGLTGSAGAAWGLFHTFVAEDAPLQVNVSASQRTAIHAQLTQHLNEHRTPPTTTFDDAVNEIEGLMARDNFPRFKKGTEYAQLISVKQELRAAERQLEGVVDSKTLAGNMFSGSAE
eukprot:g290.t1